MTMGSTHVVRRALAAVATAIACLLASAGPAVAQPQPAGGITFSPASGTDADPVGGATAGPCTSGTSNAFQVYVTGPGPFAADEAGGRPYGVALVGATVDGFSAAAPISFRARAGFGALARQLGADAVPTGTYTVEFRCIDELYLTVSRTYRSTITFSTPTAFTTPGAPPVAAPQAAPPAAAQPAPVAAEQPPARSSGGSLPWLIGAVVVTACGIGLAAALRRWAARRVSS